MGSHFEIVGTDAQKNISLQFGEFSVLIANIDRHMIRTHVQRKFAEYTRARNALSCNTYYNKEYQDALDELGISENTTPPEFCNLLFAPLFDLLDIDCLDSLQLVPITDLFLAEMGEGLDRNPNFMPLVLHDKVKHHLESVLLRENTNFSEVIANDLAQVNISSSISIRADGTMQTTYHIDSVESLLVLDLQKYLLNDKAVIRCQNPDCGRLFYPTSKKVKYCQLGHIGSEQACPEIMRRKPKDEFEKEMKNAMLAQSRCLRDAERNKGHDYDHVRLNSVYRKWLYECSEQRDYFRSTNDIEGFRKWIADTKLSPAHLEEMGIRKPIAHRKKVRG